MFAIAETPVSISLLNRIQSSVDNYFDLKNSSWGITALKVISYMTLVIPAIMCAVEVCLSCINCSSKLIQGVSTLSPVPLSENLLEIINASPRFNDYKIGKGTPYQGISLTTPYIRPANLLYEAILGPNCTTMPGSLQLFSFNIPPDQIQRHLQGEGVVEVNARGRRSEFVQERGKDDLTNLYGNATFSISKEELRSTLDSQRIYCAPILPLRFYKELKAAMARDAIVILPNVKVNQLVGQAHNIIEQAIWNPERYGFQDVLHLDQILSLTMYQLGSLVVKTEDFRVLIDENGKLRERIPGEQDALRLVNACGIRNIATTLQAPLPNPNALPVTDHISNGDILIQMYQTALQSAGTGYLVMPAVGMGVWGGDPAVYWPAFFSAVAEMNVPLEKIFVNPGHQVAHGTNGSEFAQYLNHSMAKYADNPRALANLQKVVNLFEKKTDIVHFAQNLKRAYPDKVISLFNASDPDVTLGYHVGEYVNNIGHCSTTEENYTALGTNGLCFENITGIHQFEVDHEPRRFIQVV